MRDSVRDEMRDCISMKNSVFTAFVKRVGLWDIFPPYTYLCLITILLFYKKLCIDETMCEFVPQSHSVTQTA